MRKRIAGLAFLVLLGGLTACGEGAGEPPAAPEEPTVSVDPSPTRKGTEETEETPETPEAIPEAAAGTVEYYVSGEGLMIYASREAFLAENNLEDAPLFYAFRMDEEVGSYDEDGEQTGTEVWTRRMDLYYDEETETGCGLWYYEKPEEEPSMQGFLFAETADGNDDAWHRWDRWKMDYFALPEVDKDYVQDYQEHFEHGEDGRILEFSADGFFESPWSNADGRNPVCSAEFAYDENGVLRCREYFQNDYLFGSYQQFQESHFDELSRVSYEQCYVTHGEVEYYYIYEGDNPEPSYCLFLDHDIGPSIRAEFARY